MKEVGGRNESNQLQIHIALCALELQEGRGADITACSHCVRAPILPQKLLFDIQFVEFIRRVCDMSLSSISKLFRGQAAGGNLFSVMFYDLRMK
jgi:hypothetical protein